VVKIAIDEPGEIFNRSDAEKIKPGSLNRA
jgi:hypothetical protein